MPYLERHLFICTNRRDPANPKGSCAQKGGEALKDRFKKELYDRGLKGKVRANAAGCLDQCEHGCSVVVYPEQVWYGRVTVDDVPEIIEQHIVGGKIVERLLIPNQPHLEDKVRGRG
jgi:(2Fe-2S) ferredoxin